MPEYLAPGVYVEETSFRPKTIEGVSTSTAGFVGPARYGPTSGEPELLTSSADYERLYGGLEALTFAPNFLAHAIRAFFEEGGRRCYVARVCDDSAVNASIAVGSTVSVTARFPGVVGNMRITFATQFSDNLLVPDPLDVSGTPLVRRVRENDTVVIYEPSASPPDIDLYDVVPDGDGIKFVNKDGSSERTVVSLDPAIEQVHILTIIVRIEQPINRPLQPGQRFEESEVLEGFSLHTDHPRALANYFKKDQQTRRLALTVPFFIEFGTPPSPTVKGTEYAEELFGVGFYPDDLRTTIVTLTGGTDGPLPSASSYEGEDALTATAKSGFRALEDIEDISIVAAPGYSYNYGIASPTGKARIETIQGQLISHCERMRYRIAVLDAPNDLTVTQARTFRSKIDSKYAALYYPWVRIVDPISARELHLPPSGFVAGIYARNDIERGVQKAPANEVVRLAVGFEFPINKAQQDVLNPDGVNCFRFFEGRGYRLWGARTATSDGEFKYVNIRRYLAYLERSIDKGTQVFVFESNGERLWENVRRTVEDFLFNEWKSGRLMGLTPEEAYFVRCDRTTMTQNDIDNGRLICLIGVALLRPAEFVIFRIGQKLLETRG